MKNACGCLFVEQLARVWVGRCSGSLAVRYFAALYVICYFVTAVCHAVAGRLASIQFE